MHLKNHELKHLLTTQHFSWKGMNKTLEMQQNISGLACNIDKTSVIPIGKESNKDNKICALLYILR